jgi:hypothetical protein
VTEFGRRSHIVLYLQLVSEARQGSVTVRIGRQMQHQLIGVLQVCSFVMVKKMVSMATMRNTDGRLDKRYVNFSSKLLAKKKQK